MTHNILSPTTASPPDEAEYASLDICKPDVSNTSNADVCREIRELKVYVLALEARLEEVETP